MSNILRQRLHEYPAEVGANRDPNRRHHHRIPVANWVRLETSEFSERKREAEHLNSSEPEKMETETEKLLAKLWANGDRRSDGDMDDAGDDVADGCDDAGVIRMTCSDWRIRSIAWMKRSWWWRR